MRAFLHALHCIFFALADWQIAKKDAVSIFNAEAGVYKKILFESKTDFVGPIQLLWKYMF
jgi:hypothetical protein